jgi:hypothetical protein
LDETRGNLPRTQEGTAMTDSRTSPRPVDANTSAGRPDAATSRADIIALEILADLRDRRAPGNPEVTDLQTTSPTIVTTWDGGADRVVAVVEALAGRTPVVFVASYPQVPASRGWQVDIHSEHTALAGIWRALRAGEPRRG